MYSHTIKSHSKSIHKDRNEIHLGASIGPKCLNRSQYMRVSFFESEEIGSREDEKNPESSTKRYSLSKKQETRKDNRNTHEPLHRSNIGDIPEGKSGEVKKLSEIVKNPTTQNYPNK